MKNITDLTKEEIEFIINDIFDVKRITNIIINRQEEEIVCTVYQKNELVPDKIVLRNPFNHGSDAISGTIPVAIADYDAFKAFILNQDVKEAEEQKKTKTENRD